MSSHHSKVLPAAFDRLVRFCLLLVTVSCIAAPALPANAEDTYQVPLQQADGWQQLTFNGIKANQVSFGEQGMRVDVNQSASPLIYPFAEALNAEEISATLEFTGDVRLDGKLQGDKGADDFAFRLGLVVAGDRRLNFLQRSIAAGWIKTLYGMAADGTGIRNIEFYNIYSDKRLAGNSREHPLSDLMVEHFITERPENGELELTFKPELSSPVLALWISIDGDDTKSSYSVLLKNLSLKTE